MPRQFLDRHEVGGQPDGLKRRQGESCVDLRGCRFGLTAGWVHKHRRTSGNLWPNGGRQSQRVVFPAASSSASSPSASNTMTIDITIANGKTTPSGEKINVSVGEKVILNVTSDIDDEVDAHIGGPGYELEVKAGTPAKGEFTVDSPGSFEVESHHLEKIIVILNAR